MVTVVSVHVVAFGEVCHTIVPVSPVKFIVPVLPAQIFDATAAAVPPTLGNGNTVTVTFVDD